MKLVILAVIASSAIAAAAQSNGKTAPDIKKIPGFISQVACPVVFTDVSLQNDGRFMPVQQGAAQDGSLAFQYKNLSGKLIQSIEIRVELRVKRSVYDLDATTISRDMTLTADAKETLPLHLIAYSLERVTLEQVNYVGGKIWRPKATNTCNYENPATSERIGTLR